MKKEDLAYIEGVIQYQFNNIQLLRQAFMYYTDDSKVLSVVGKRAISFAVTHILTEYYGRYNHNSLFEISSTNEGLNDILNNISSSGVLTDNIELFGLDSFVEEINDTLVYNNKFQLMEAIIGAITLDSNYDLNVLVDCVGYLLNVDYYLDNGFKDKKKNFALTIRNWAVNTKSIVPSYSFDAYFDEVGNYIFSCRIIVDGVDVVIEGEGHSKSEARNNCATKFYAYLLNNKMISEEEKLSREPKLENAVKQLEMYSKEGYFARPVYKYKKTAQNTYICRVSINGYPEIYEAESESQSEATKMAAYSMLLFVLGYTE